MLRDPSVEFSEDIIEQVWNQQDGRCLTCRIRLSKNNHEKGEKGAWHAHHIRPVACKGERNIENCAIICNNTCHKMAHPDPHDCTKTPQYLGTTRDEQLLSQWPHNSFYSEIF